MDLGRPVARHVIRRPHEVIELGENDVEVTLDDVMADEETVASETSER
jgi:hypothetical protein